MGERFETCVTPLDSIGKNYVDGLNHLGRCRHSKSVLLKRPNVINPIEEDVLKRAINMSCLQSLAIFGICWIYVMLKR